MRQDPAIVITGLGLTTCLGSTAEQTWAAVMNARCGIGPMTAMEQRPLPDKGGGQALDLPSDYFPDLPRVARYLRHAVEQARRMRGAPNTSPKRCGAVFGTTLHGMNAGGRFFRTDDPRELREFLAGRVAALALSGLGIHGPVLTTCSACSSGLSAIALAVTLLRTGELDLVVAGGYDCVSEYAYAGFDSLRLIAPGSAMPFAADRDGMKVGEGYASLILERESHAAASGRVILGYVAGCGESSDAFHLTQPHPEGAGAAQAIRAALLESARTPRDIDMIAAHGTATPNNDAAEYAAFRSVFGDPLSDKPVVAFKSHLGHTLGGAGAVELALSAMARLEGRIPPMPGTAPIDPAFLGLKLVQGVPVERPIRTTLNTSLGFGGANTCVVLSDRAPGTPSPSNEANEVVITGVGVVVPGGVGNGAFLDLLHSSGPEPPKRDTGAIPEAEYAHMMSGRRARRMSDYAKLTLAATAAACEDGRADAPAFLEGCGAILGTTHGASSFCEAFYSQIVRDGIGAANPVLFAEGVPNVAGAHLSMAFGVKGGCQTIIGTRCAGLDALRLAALRIREGRWSSALVSAAEEYSPVVNRAYQACGLYGGDADRYPDRFVTGSGAVTLVLESRNSAEERKARVRAVIEVGAWSVGSEGRSATAEALEALGRPRYIATAYGRAPVDPSAAQLVADSPQPSGSAVPWSIQGAIPELFSVGPLASLAAVLLGAPIPGWSGMGRNRPFAVLASEFTGTTTAVRARPAFHETDDSRPTDPLSL